MAVAPPPAPPADETLAAAELKPRSEEEKKVLNACAVFYGAPVIAEHVTAVAGVSDARPMLEDFEKRGLVESHDNRYMLANDVNNALLGNLNPWFTRALTHFEEWLEQHQGNHRLIAESAGPILLIMQWAVAAKFWLEVRHLGHGVEEALAVTGQWDRWASALEAVLKAAKREENRAEEGWALHQLGTRALCLGAHTEAKASLTDALHLREALNDQAGAAVTRHNLNLLLLPQPPEQKPEPKVTTAPLPEAKPEPTPRPEPTPPPVPRRWPMLLKLGVPVLLAFALLTALVVWLLIPNPVVAQVNIKSFTVDPADAPPGASAQLCYVVENATSVSIEPAVSATQPTGGCVSISAEQTTVYTLTAVGADGKSVTRQITLNVAAKPPDARIVRFEVLREVGPGGPSDIQFRLCYEVRDAAHAELDNNGGEVVLNEPRCQRVQPEQTTVYTLTATGADGRNVSRQVTVDATKPPAPPPQILSFEAVPGSVVAGEKAQLCFQVREATSVQIDSGTTRAAPGTERQCISVAVMKTTVYTLTAVNAEGQAASRQATIRVTRSAPQIVSFSAQPNSLRSAGSTRLCYETLNADRLLIDQGVGVVSPGKGCVDAKVSETTTFTLTAVGAERQTERSQTRVEVAREPAATIEVEFTAQPDRITVPEAANLCYRIKNASTVAIDPGFARLRVPPAGERACVRVEPKQTTTYTLTATGSLNRQETRQVTVNTVVKPTPPPKHARILFFEATPTRIRPGGTVRLCYGVADAMRAGIAPFRNDIPLVAKECLTDSPDKTTRYVLRAMGEDRQTEAQEATVEVVQPQSPPVRITRFEINPTLVHGTQLCYGLENARSARIDPDVGALNNLTAGCPRIRSSEARTYTLTATGQDGKTAQQSVRYTPPEPPKPTPIRITSFSPATQKIKQGAQARICYSTFGEGSAQISPTVGRVPPSLLKRCVTVSPQQTTVYVLTVTGPNKETDSRRAVVNVEKPGILIR